MFLNCMTLIGFTGREPKTFSTSAGKEIARLSVATTKRYQEDSEWKEKTQWHDCVLYGSAAQYAANLPKGSHVFMEGELSYREYTRTIESESGAVNVQWPVAEIVVDSIKVLDRKKKEIREWLNPFLVGQFEFAEWTPDSHLRHSRFVALRDEKNPKGVGRE